MRDVLFRGKRVDNGEIVEGFYIFDGFNHYIVKFYIDENAEGTLYPVQEAFEVIPETVGQFTGLTDKNGKKIFEGDIITISSACVCMTGIVEFHDCGFEVHEYDTYEVLWYYPDELEVIGNIHDNPEMLEATQDGT